MRLAPRIAACLLLFLSCLPALPAQEKAPAYVLSVVTDRKDALYRAGERVDFLISVTQDNKIVEGADVAYEVSVDGYRTLIEGKTLSAAKPVGIVGMLDQPGFLLCRVMFEPKPGMLLQAWAGAAVDPLSIKPSLPVPADFDEFWKSQKDALAKLPADPKLTPVDSPKEGIECFDAQIACLGPRPVSGYFARPKGAQPKSLPAVLTVHGAGVRGSILAVAAGHAAAGRLAMDINAHGIPNGKPPEFYEELSRGELKDYPHAGRDSRDTSYFLGMYLRLMRALDFLASQPEWDGRVLVVTGHSQGGGQSLVAAGLDPRVTGLASGVPAMCDHTGNAAERINGWPKLVPLGPDQKPEPKALEASRYFDAVNFAARTQADAILSVGFIDRTCPPTSVYAAYNALAGKKRMIAEPLMGHAAPGEIQKAFEEWIGEHVRQRKGQ